MSTTIDEKVVEMRFDNKQFEANVKTSISTLDKLKQSLNLGSAAKGLENINDAAKKCDMSALGKSVEAVKMKFSALEIMGMTALANITNSALNTGKRIASALTVQPVMTGFNEYETKMGSIQTIMSNTASKGTTMADVTRVIDELNTYADKTIYNFAEMTRNIGTFTAAGVGLEESAKAIQGIANLAAASGSNSQQASTAMYQLSQALASGTVKLMDWNSVVNAGMGGEKFQEALKATAREHGIAIDDIIEKNGSFRESLQEGWLSADVLNETLNKFTVDGAKAYAQSMMEAGKYTQEQADALIAEAQSMEDAATKVKTFTQLLSTLKESAQSGWGKTWEIIVGDFDEAKELFTEISDTLGGLINDSAEARNNILLNGLASGWKQLLNQGIADGEGFRQTVLDIAAEHGIAVDEMRDDTALFNKSLKDGWLSSDILSESIDAFSSKISKMSEEELKAAGYTAEQVEQLKALNDEVKNGSISMDEFAGKISSISGRENLIESLKNSFYGIMNIIATVSEAFRETELFPSLTADRLYSFTEGLKEASERFKELFSIVRDENGNIVEMSDTLSKLKRTFKGLFAIVDIFTTLTGGALKSAIKVAARLLGMVDADILDITANVGDAIVAFRDWIDQHNFLAKGIEKVLPYLESGVKSFRNWIASLGELPIVQEAVSRFGNAFQDTSERFGAFMKGGTERINDFIERVKAMDSLSLGNIGKILVDFRDNVLGYFLNFDGVFGGLIQAVKDFGTDVKTVFGEATDGANQAAAEMKTTLGGIVQFFIDTKNRIFETALEIREKLADKIGFSEIFALGLGAAMVAFTKKISDALETISAPFKGIGRLMKSASKALKAFAMETESKALLNVAKAVAVLVISLGALTLLDQEKLKGAVITLGVLAAGLLAASFAMSKMGSFEVDIKKGVARLPASIVSIAASLLILTSAMKILSGLSGQQIAGSIAILGILAAGLVGISKLLTSKDKLFSTSAVFMLGFAASLKLLVGALGDIDKLDLNNTGRTMALLLGAVASLVLLAAACKNVNFGGAATVLAIIISLKLLSGCFQDIANIDIGKVKSKIGTFIAIFGMFGVLMVASKQVGEHAGKAGAMVLKMSAALTLIALSFKIIAEIGSLDLDRAVNTVIKMLLVFAILTEVSQLSGENASRAGSMIFKMSGAILVMSSAMVALAHVDPSGLNRALKAVSTLLLVFGGLIAITQYAKDAKDVQGTLIVLTVAVTALVASIAELSLLNPDRLRGATVAITSLVAVFSLLVASTKYATQAGGTLVVMTGVAAGLAGILALMSTFNVQSAITNACALSVLLTSMSASLLILSKASVIAPTAYAAIGIMTAVVAGLAAILGIMDGLGVEASIETAASLSVLLLSMSGACLILAGVGKTGPAAFVGIGALAALIAGIGVIMTGICDLTADNPTVEKDLDRAIMVMEKIGTGLGAALGGFVGGALGGLSSGLPIIGGNLAGFMANAQPFFDAVKGIDGAVMAGVKSLAETLLILTGVNVAEGLTSWLTGGTSLAAFADELNAFAPKFVEYSNTVAGNIDADAVTASANAAMVLAELANKLPKSGGFIEEFFGGNDIDAFGSKLQSFGECLVGYSNTISGNVNADAITASTNAAMSLTELANNLPNSGGFISNFFGENDIDTFGTKLQSFGECLVGYSDTVAGNIDDDAITSSANAGKALVELGNNIPNSGGQISKFFGENDINTFGTQLVSFGGSLVEYSKKVTEGNGVTEETVSASICAGKALVELANTIPNSAGPLTTFFEGTNDIDAFGEKIVAFGESLVAYSNAITKDGGVNAEAVTASANAAQALSNLANGLPDSSLFDKWFGGDQTLATFGDDIADFGDAMSNYNAKISGIDIPTMGGVVTAAWSLVDLAKVVKGIDKNAFSGFASSLTSLADTGITGFTDAFQNSNSAVTDSVSTMIGYIKMALKNHTPTVIKEVTSAAATVVSGVVSEIRKKRSNFVSCGTYLMQGLAQGIRSGRSTVVSAAIAMSNATADAARDALGVHSPSLVFKKIGGFLAEGLGTGIVNNVPYAVNASANMGWSVADSINSVLGNTGASVGNTFANSIASGIFDHMPDAVNASSDMGKSVTDSINSALGNTGTSVGNAFADSVAYGISENDSPEEAAKDKAQAIADAFKSELDKLDLDMTTKDLELNLWKSTAGQTADVDDSAYAEIEAVVQKIALQQQAVNVAYKEFGETVKAFGESSEEAQEAYNKYLQEQIDLAELNNKIAEKNKEIKEASYQSSLDWIEEEKYYNRLTLTDELAAYKRIQSSYAKGTDERKKTDREIYRLEKEIYEAQEQYASDVQRVQSEANQKRLDLEQEYADKVKSINDNLASDIQSLNDQYQNALESRTKSLYQSYGLFDEVKEREEVSGATLMKNLQEQVQEFGQWQDILDSLSARGLDSELIGELQEMGPSAIAEIKALNSMSDSELEKYAGLWSIKHAQARGQAIDELEGLRIETRNNIAQLRVEADQELEEYRYVWQQKMDQVTVDANAELEQLRKDFGEKVGLIKKNTEQEMQAMADVVKTILREAGWDETGKQIVAGLTGGVESEKPSFLGALVNMAMAGVQAVKKALDINSPSRVFRELGSYTGLGFVGGLKDYADKSYDAGANMAESAKDGLSDAISMVAELANGDFDMHPTIRPVLDLSDVTRTAGQLNGLFYPQRTLALAGQTSLAFNSTMNGDGMAVKVDNRDIVDELRSLRSDMAAMTDRMKRMQVVLDTGALVGEMAEPMDAALGWRQTYRGRGI